MHKMVNTAFLNCCNFKANQNYAHFLLLEYDIVYLNELWLKPNEKYLLDHYSDTQIKHNKSILFKSDIDFDYVKGRPFGGQAWFINKNYKIINFEFINKHLSFVHLQINHKEIIFIGTHLPFFNSKF